MNKIKQMLAEIIQEDFIDEWLKTPNKSFDNKTPLEIIEEQGYGPIEEMCYRLKSGMPM